jgi:hypothetical protein
VKYINHMTTSVDDDKHVASIEACGLEGYGAYWVIAEKIGAQIRPEQINVWITRSWTKWAQILSVSTRKCHSIIETLSELHLILLVSNEKYAAIGMPNLLKYADEYTKKILRDSGDISDIIRRMSSPPALPAFRRNKDLKSGHVDNSQICGILAGADVGGRIASGTAPDAPTPSEKGNGVDEESEELTLSPDQQAAYDDLDDQGRAWIDTQPAAERARILQAQAELLRQRERVRAP